MAVNDREALLRSLYAAFNTRDVEEGNVISEGDGRHVYEFRDDLIERMTIEE